MVGALGMEGLYSAAMSHVRGLLSVSGSGDSGWVTDETDDLSTGEEPTKSATVHAGHESWWTVGKLAVSWVHRAVRLVLLKWGSSWRQ